MDSDHENAAAVYESIRQAFHPDIEYLINTNMVKNFFDVNYQYSDGKTLLHIAIDHQLWSIIPTLIDRGAKVNAKDNEGWTPLHRAVVHGCKEISELLIEKGALIDATDSENYTSLHHAIEMGCKEIAELLIAKGADINLKTPGLRTALHLAADAGCRDIIQLLINKGIPVDIRDNSSYFFIEKYLDLDNRQFYYCTPLHCAVINRREDAVDELIKNNADINAQNSQGDTPLHLAFCRTEKNTNNVIIGRLSLVRPGTAISGSEFCQSIFSSQCNIIQILMSKGADVVIKNRQGRTPLDVACAEATNGREWPENIRSLLAQSRASS